VGGGPGWAARVQVDTARAATDPNIRTTETRWAAHTGRSINPRRTPTTLSELFLRTFLSARPRIGA
jgi:hypothetical protein